MVYIALTVLLLVAFVLGTIDTTGSDGLWSVVLLLCLGFWTLLGYLRGFESLTGVTRVLRDVFVFASCLLPLTGAVVARRRLTAVEPVASVPEPGEDRPLTGISSPDRAAVRSGDSPTWLDERDAA
jgi:hypothetical protein